MPARVRQFPARDPPKAHKAAIRMRQFPVRDPSGEKFLMDLGALYIFGFGCHPALYPLANLHPPSWIGLSTYIVSRMGVKETRLQLNSSNRYRRVSKLSRTDLSLKPSSTQTKDSL